MKPKLIAFLINLDRRPDRWNEFVNNSSGLSFPINKYSAVDGLLLPQDQLKIPMPVAACWMSHQGVAKSFLDSGADYCLVLEDDISLDAKAKRGLEDLCQKDLRGIDLLQIGFCVSHDRLSNRVRYSTQHYFIGWLYRSKLLRIRALRQFAKFMYGYEFQEQGNLNRPVAVQTFELGTHAYIVSRTFAEAILSFNNPVYLPADLAIMELVETKGFNALRLSKSLINQSDSPSSISNASSNALENEIARHSRSWSS